MTTTVPLTWSNITQVPAGSGGILTGGTTGQPVITGGNSLVGEATVPAGQAPSTNTYVPAYLTGSGHGDQVPIEPSTEVVFRFHYVVDIPPEMGSVDVGFNASSPNIDYRTNPATSPTPGAPALVSGTTFLYQDVQPGQLVFDAEVRGVPAPGIHAPAPNGSIMVSYAAGLPAVTADRVIRGTITGTAEITPMSIPAGPNVLHFRDPADGVFKPLTEVRVRGIQ